METFDASWLALREPIDHRSRPAALASRLAGWCESRVPLRVLDLGSGSGSNLRYLAHRLSGPQEWTLVDHDRALLEGVEFPGEGVDVTRVVADLATEGRALIRGRDLVTASALLDLVSASWLKSIVDACVDTGCAVLFSLSYDGTIAWASSDESSASDTTPTDERVRAAVDEHQRQDKGLGPALGPAAGQLAEDLFRERGYRTWSAPSPWRLRAEETELASRLVRGWVEATLELEPGEGERLNAWARQKLEAFRRGELDLTVGHLDVLALPADGTRPGSESR